MQPQRHAVTRSSVSRISIHQLTKELTGTADKRSFTIFLFLICVLGLHGKVFIAGGATGVASVRSCWKLSLCPTEPVPASSKLDLLLAKAEPISDSGSTSGVTHLRRKKEKKKTCVTAIEAGEE